MCRAPGRSGESEVPRQGGGGCAARWEGAGETRGWLSSAAGRGECLRGKRSRLIVALLTLISHQSCSNLSCAQRTSGEAEGEEWGSKQGRR